MFEPPAVCGFREAAFFNAVFRSDVFFCKIILLECLQKMLCGCVFFKMEKDQGPQVVLSEAFFGVADGPDDALAEKAMRPSSTFNAVIDAI